MKQIKYLIFTVIVSIFVSCDTDEFLNPLPDTAAAVEGFYQSDADVLAGVYGIYDALQGVNDHTNSSESNTNRGVQFEHLLTEHRSDNTRNSTTEGSKADFHRYLVNVNNVESEDYYASMYEVIFRANNVLEYVNIADAGNQAQYTAQAKFCRAYAYFKLVRMFGAVPLVTKVILPAEKALAFTRVAEAGVYAQIEADLLDAIGALDNSSKSTASKAAAQGILAKAYLSQPSPNYSGAQGLCESIMGSGFALQSNYSDVFYNELNSEIIFAIQYETGNSAESQGFSSEFTGGSRRQGNEDGQNVVNDNLIADFVAAGGNRTAVSIVTYADATEVAKFLPFGSDITVSPPTFGATPRDSGNDYIALRYSDVLLMHVEAIMGSGTSTTSAAAVSSLQAVRDRAGLTAAVATPISKTDLLLERRVEFAFENQRMFDLVRFGVAESVLGDHATAEGYVFSPRDLLLPIPQREINISEGLLKQNPGY